MYLQEIRQKKCFPASKKGASLPDFSDDLLHFVEAILELAKT